MLNAKIDAYQENLTTPTTPSERKGGVVKRSSNYYFGEKEEKAFIRYCQLPDGTERSKLFSDILYPAFTKMVESIIRTYHLLPLMRILTKRSATQCHSSL